LQKAQARKIERKEQGVAKPPKVVGGQKGRPPIIGTNKEYPDKTPEEITRLRKAKEAEYRKTRTNKIKADPVLYEAYKKKRAEYLKKKYNEDPEWRTKRIATVKRCNEKLVPEEFAGTRYATYRYNVDPEYRARVITASNKYHKKVSDRKKAEKEKAEAEAKARGEEIPLKKKKARKIKTTENQ
jgi:hypothetical protein